jgi:hypothetical protein
MLIKDARILFALSPREMTLGIRVIIDIQFYIIRCQLNLKLPRGGMKVMAVWLTSSPLYNVSSFALEFQVTCNRR